MEGKRCGRLFARHCERRPRNWKETSDGNHRMRGVRARCLGQGRGVSGVWLPTANRAAVDRRHRGAIAVPSALSTVRTFAIAGSDAIPVGTGASRWLASSPYARVRSTTARGTAPTAAAWYSRPHTSAGSAARSPIGLFSQPGQCSERQAGDDRHRYYSDAHYCSCGRVVSTEEDDRTRRREPEAR